MLNLTLLALTLPASATTIVFQEDVRGGVAVDASAVDASATGSSSLASGPAFQITIPTTATVTEAFLILMAKPDGFLDTESAVRVNGFDLSFGTLVSVTDVAEVYSLPPTVYGITSTGPVSYQEEGSAEDDFHFGPGIVGATLAVIYEDYTLNGNRHIVIATENVSDGAAVLTGLPELDGIDSVVVSYGITNECANDQVNAVVVDSAFVSSTAGGSDDGPSYSGSCGGQDWNTLVTQGSFGVDDTDTIVGVDGDSLDSVPASGTSTNSRLDDELYRLTYDRSGDLTLGYSDSSEDSQLTVLVAAIELDADGDLIPDSADNCPDTYNPDQTDSDVDGIGDACAGCLDIDGDGYGVEGITDDCRFPGEPDCDDSDASISPSAEEIWYDGIDQNCDGLSDYDQDGDGDDDERYGGGDCDDTDPRSASIFEEDWYNGVDNDCIPACDYDQDADGCPAAGEFEGASADPLCDVSCFYTASEDTGTPEEDTEGDGGDCDDTEPSAFPGSPEIWYDGVDQDCDGNDDDRDGDGEASTEAGGTDCDDDNASINSAAAEIWYDGVDQDCDGLSDYDSDYDGHDSVDYDGEDCDDDDAAINPDAFEIWYDGVDQDCNGLSDYDQDLDGYDSSEHAEDGTDCDDLNQRIYPDATEIWYDGVDQDCSGTSDFDQDGDGFDRRPEGDDCNDLEVAINPDAEEINGDDIDQDCDGDLDFYPDSDGDGSPDDVDCDPSNPEIYPDMPGFDGCDEIVDPGLIGKGIGVYKGGGCSQAPTRFSGLAWLLGLTVIARRRRDASEDAAKSRA